MSNLKMNIEALCHIAQNPREQLDKVLAEGKKAVGVMPYFAPEELVYAAGMVPFGLWGAMTQVSESKRYFPAFYCSIIHTVLELGIRGEYNGLSAVMISLACDSLKGMGTNWSYGVKDIPVIDVAYAMNRKIPAGVEFTRSQVHKIKGRLEEICGVKIEHEAVVEAIRIYNENRRECLRFTELAASHGKSVGPEARALVLKARYFMDRKLHTAALKDINDVLEAMEKEPAGKRIVTTGIIADHPQLLKILEENGFTIVADQITHESADFRVLADESKKPCEAIAERLSRIDGTSVLYEVDKSRCTELVELAKASGADGVLWVLTKFCDPEEFDYVPGKAALDKAGIPNLIVELDQQMVNFEQVRTAIETFGEIL